MKLREGESQTHIEKRDRIIFEFKFIFFIGPEFKRKDGTQKGKEQRKKSRRTKIKG